MPWKGALYPPTLDAKDYLSYYSNIFNFVEVNIGDGIINQNNNDNRLQRGYSASHENRYRVLYNIARKWAKQTPEDFRFAVRIPRAILFDNNNTILATSAGKNDNYNNNNIPLCPNKALLDQFLESLAPIEEKVLVVTIEIPPSLTLAIGRGWLESVLGICTYHSFSVALQFNHNSWFQDLTYNLLRRYDASVIWSYDINHPYPHMVAVSNFLYFRPSSNNNNNYHHHFSNTSSNKDSFDSTKEIKKHQFDKLIETIVEKVQEDKDLEYMIIVVEHPLQASLLHEVVGIPAKIPIASEPSKTISPSQHNAKITSAGLSIDASRTAGGGNRLIACVDLNAFYPSCEELRNPTLKGKPHAVIMTDQKEGNITKGVVSSCSYEARKYGVKSAMALSKAKMLCPDLILLPVDISYYSKVSEQVMSVLEPFADVLEQASIDEAFLDCTMKITEGKDSIEALKQYGMSIKEAIKEKCSGLLCSVGIAPTKSAAKIACDYKKPDGLTVVPLMQLKEFLDPLEVSTVSGIGPKTEQALKEMGITTLGQLARADVQRLVERFGKNGYWIWKVANGTDEELVSPRSDHVSLSTETTLETYTHDKEQIRSMLHALVDEIYQKAVEYGYSFRTVGIKLVRTNFTIETRETTFAEAQYDKKNIDLVIDPLLEKFVLSDKKEPAAIRKVGLKLSHLSRKGAAQSERIGGHYSEVQKTLLDYI